MSDEEEQYVSEDETQSDFSASEDEWPATDNDTESSDSDFQDDICSDDEVMDTPEGRAKSSSLSTRQLITPNDAIQLRTKKCLSQSVRNKSSLCTTQNVSANSRVSITLKRSTKVTISRSTRKSNLLSGKRD